MYNFNKIVGYILSPIGVTIFSGSLAVLFAWFKNSCVAKCIGGFTVSWLWIWMTPAMSWVVGASLEREFLVDGRVPLIETFPEADAIVLLGGSMGISTNLSTYAEMYGSADRVWQAARLYKARKAPIVIATNGMVEETTFPLLREFGIPGDALVKAGDARNTEAEAKSISNMGVKRILLVTSAWHMKRARLMFEKYAPDAMVICAPSDFENSITAAGSLSFTDFLPDPSALMGNSVALHEWVGIAGYKLFR